MFASDVMTKTVITIRPNTSVLDAIRLMLGQRISGLPVVNAAGELVGMLTEGDLLRRVETGTERTRPRWLDFLRDPGSKAADYVRSHGRKVDELMTGDVASVREDTPLEEVVALMESRRVKRVAVVRDNRLIGIVSRADLLRALVETVATPPAATTDDAIRDQIIAELQRQSWGGRGQITVVVTEGVAYLEGIVYDLRERDAIRVAAENVPGVVSVRDNLDFFEANLALSYGV